MTHATVYTPVPINGPDDVHKAFYSFLAAYEGITRAGYEDHLNRYFDWCREHHLDILHGMDRGTLLMYVRYLSEIRGNSASSIGTILTPIKGFYRMAHIDGVIDRNPAEYVKPPRVFQDDQRRGLTAQQLRIMLAASERVSPRHHALMFLLGELALRISEACNVRIEDYQQHERGHQVLRLVGKGNKPATMPLTVPIIRALDSAAGDRTSGHLLTTVDGRPLTRHAGAGLLRTIVKRSGIEQHVHPHMLRASAITAALDAGASLRKVQGFARHEDPRVTMSYDRARNNLDDHAVHVLSAFLSGR